MGSSMRETITGAVVQAVVTSIIGTLLGAIATIMVRPLQQKLESTGAFNLEAQDVVGQYGTDLVEHHEGLTEIGGRESELETLILDIRARRNPCIIGEAGVGKTALVEGLAVRIANGDVPSYAKNWRIIKIDFPSLIVGKGYGGGSADGIIRLRALFEYSEKNPDAVIFIDEVHQFSGYADLCKTYMDRQKVRLVGATTSREFAEYIGRDEALARRFSTIKIERPTVEQVNKIVNIRAASLKKQFNVNISNDIILLNSLLNRKYRPYAASPDREIKSLSVACEIATSRRDLQNDGKVSDKGTAKSTTQKRGLLNKVGSLFIKTSGGNSAKKSNNTPPKANSVNSETIEITEDHIREAITKLSNTDITRPDKKLAEKLIALAPTIKERLFGQDEVVETICNRLLYTRFEMVQDNDMRGAFLLAGPSGTGKTHLWNLLEEAFENTYNINAAQFKDSQIREAVLNAVSTTPDCLLVFEDIDKAKDDVKSDIISILDQGYAVNSKNIKVNFKNAVVILTVSTDSEAKTKQETRKSLESKLGLTYINRIQNCLIFNPMSDEKLAELSELSLNVLFSTLEQGYGLKIEYDNDDLIKRMVDAAKAERSNARGIIKYRDHKIFNMLSMGIMSDKIKIGDKIKVYAEDDQIKYQVFRNDQNKK